MRGPDFESTGWMHLDDFCMTRLVADWALMIGLDAIYNVLFPLDGQRQVADLVSNKNDLHMHTHIKIRNKFRCRYFAMKGTHGDEKHSTY